MGYRFKERNKSKGHYVYTLNLEGGKKYVGYSSNVKRRIAQHFNGTGAAVTRECRPISVHSVKKCSSKEKAQNAERIVYYNMKNYHGSDKVRGAGNTTRFSLSKEKKRNNKRNSSKWNTYEQPDKQECEEESDLCETDCCDLLLSEESDCYDSE